VIAEEGENVVPASWGESSGAATAEEICERGSDAIEATCEVTDSASITALRGQEPFDGVDTLVNSPSGIVRKPVAKVIEGTGDTS
jgi:NADP-dependent 3-hydroxy acid dehydrogenase YdfG